MDTPFRNVAISSWCWYEPYYAGIFSLLHVPQAAKSLGFTAVELNDFMLPPPRFSRIRQPLFRFAGLHSELWRYDPYTLRQLKTALNQTGVGCIAWTVDSDFTVPAHHWFRQQIYLRLAIWTARYLGATILRITFAGTAQMPAAIDKIILARLLWLIPVAQPLTIAVENHAGITENLSRLAQTIGYAKQKIAPTLSQSVGICLDTAHIPTDQTYLPLLPHTVHVHLKTPTFPPSNWQTHPIFHQLPQFTGYFVLERAPQNPISL